MRLPIGGNLNLVDDLVIAVRFDVFLQVLLLPDDGLLCGLHKPNEATHIKRN